METKSNMGIKRFKASHPGLIVAHWIEEEGIKQKYLADKMSIPQSRLSEFLHGKRNMSEELAMKLAEHFGMDADYWMRLQIQYDYDERVFELDKTKEDIACAKLESSVTIDYIKEYTFNMNVYLINENKKMIAYCPSLDLSASGDSENDALANIYRSFQLYVEKCIKKGTLEADLIAYGWKFRANEVAPPTDDAIRDKKELKKLLRSTTPFRRVNIPAIIRL